MGFPVIAPAASQTFPVLSSSGPFAPSSQMLAATAMQVVGRDLLSSPTIFIAVDTTNGLLRIANSPSGPWSDGNGFPTNVDATHMYGVARSKDGQLWALAKDTVTNLLGIYHAAPVAFGNTAYTWTLNTTFPAGSDGQIRGIACGDSSQPNSVWTQTFKYALNWGDPVGGPQIMRAAGGATAVWSVVHGPIAGNRHYHAVACDPYHAGHVYVTGGDGNVTDTIIRSTDYGTTWTVLKGGSASAWQSTQISFDPTNVYFASDTHQVSAFYMKRSDLTFHQLAPNWHGMIAVPGGAALDQFYPDAFCIVDPATGIVYLVAEDGGSALPGNRSGLFYCLYPGDTIKLLDVSDPLQTKPSVRLGSNSVIWGSLWHPLLTYEKV